MLGRDHALLAAVVYLTAAPPITQAVSGQTLDPSQLAIGGIVCSAFALLPDIDEPHSTVSVKLGPISKAVSEFTNKVAGGHRKATHSILFAADVVALSYFAVGHALATAILVGCCAMLVLRLLLPRWLTGAAPLFLIPLLSAGAAYWAYKNPVPGLPWVCGAGVILHLVGDTVTASGVPWLWPSKRKLAIPLLGHVASVRETVTGVCLSLLLAYLCWVLMLSPILGYGHHAIV
jgi:membrane-bound metal-dependent hydrolase YbcI (DUF457 family)